MKNKTRNKRIKELTELKLIVIKVSKRLKMKRKFRCGLQCKRLKKLVK